MKVLVRKQWSFKASDCKLKKLFELMDCHDINILSIDSHKYKKDKNRVDLIVGLVDCTKKDKCWNKKMKCLFKKAGICDFCKKRVVQTADHDVNESGVIHKEYDALIKKLCVSRIYLAEASSVIYDVSDIDKAVCILSNL